jgi:hypothetical protein
MWSVEWVKLPKNAGELYLIAQLSDPNLKKGNYLLLAND